MTLFVPQAARSFFSLSEEKAGLRFCQLQSLGRGAPNLRGGNCQGFPQRALKKHKEKAFLQTESLKGGCSLKFRPSSGTGLGMGRGGLG